MTELTVTPEDMNEAAEMVAEGPTADTKFNLHVFTNDPTNPVAVKQLEMLYRAVLASKIGLMHAKNTATGRIDTLLVGVELDEVQGLLTYPLAKLLSEEDTNIYLPPDGNGGYGEPVEPTVN